MDYSAWARVYGEYLSTVEKIEIKTTKAYISRSTLTLIEYRKNRCFEMTEEERNNIDNQMKKAAKKDKRLWKLGLVQKTMSCKEKWAGIKVLKEDFKPKVYARKNLFGEYIQLGEEATAEYLEKDQ